MEYGFRAWIKENNGVILHDGGSYCLARFSKPRHGGYYIDCYYRVDYIGKYKGEMKKQHLTRGGWLELSGEAEARELAANPEKAMNWILTYIKQEETLLTGDITPEIILDRDTSPATVADTLKYYNGAETKALAVTNKYYIVEAFWPAKTVYSKISEHYPVSNFDSQPVDAEDMTESEARNFLRSVGKSL